MLAEPPYLKVSNPPSDLIDRTVRAAADWTMTCVYPGRPVEQQRFSRTKAYRRIALNAIPVRH
jgi:hypothetical protein